jgi:hypothetical protein
MKVLTSSMTRSDSLPPVKKMTRVDEVILEIEQCYGDSDRVSGLYEDLMQGLLELPLWSPSSLTGRRIPWRLAPVARRHSSMKSIFNSPGIYLFGDAAAIPRYLGITCGRKTSGTFDKRMRRYLWGPKSQCALAEAYERELCENGIDGFPLEVREWYRKSYGNSTVRLKGAVDFARHGIQGVWVALLPIQQRELISSIEEHLIPVANEWNLARKYPSLINIQHKR